MGGSKSEGKGKGRAVLRDVFARRRPSGQTNGRERSSSAARPSGIHPTSSRLGTLRTSSEHFLSAQQLAALPRDITPNVPASMRSTPVLSQRSRLSNEARPSGPSTPSPERRMPGFESPSAQTSVVPSSEWETEEGSPSSRRRGSFVYHPQYKQTTSSLADNSSRGDLESSFSGEGGPSTVRSYEHPQTLSSDHENPFVDTPPALRHPRQYELPIGLGLHIGSHTNAESNDQLNRRQMPFGQPSTLQHSPRLEFNNSSHLSSLQNPSSRQTGYPSPRFQQTPHSARPQRSRAATGQSVRSSSYGVSPAETLRYIRDNSIAHTGQFTGILGSRIGIDDDDDIVGSPSPYSPAPPSTIRASPHGSTTRLMPPSGFTPTPSVSSPASEATPRAQQGQGQTWRYMQQTGRRTSTAYSDDRASSSAATERVQHNLAQSESAMLSGATTSLLTNDTRRNTVWPSRPSVFVSAVDTDRSRDMARSLGATALTPTIDTSGMEEIELGGPRASSPHLLPTRAATGSTSRTWRRGCTRCLRKVRWLFFALAMLVVGGLVFGVAWWASHNRR